MDDSKTCVDILEDIDRMEKELKEQLEKMQQNK